MNAFPHLVLNIFHNGLVLLDFLYNFQFLLTVFDLFREYFRPFLQLMDVICVRELFGLADVYFHLLLSLHLLYLVNSFEKCGIVITHLKYEVFFRLGLALLHAVHFQEHFLLALSQLNHLFLQVVSLEQMITKVLP